MRIVLLALGLLVAGTRLAAEETEKMMYESTYDDLDLMAILNDDEERGRYYGCLMDTGPCHTDAAVFIRGMAPEAVMTVCRYCTAKQMKLFMKLSSWYVNHQPEEWSLLVAKLQEDAKQLALKLSSSNE